MVTCTLRQEYIFFRKCYFLPYLFHHIVQFLPYFMHISIVPSLISSQFQLWLNFFPTQKVGNMQEYNTPTLKRSIHCMIVNSIRNKHLSACREQPKLVTRQVEMLSWTDRNEAWRQQLSNGQAIFLLVRWTSFFIFLIWMLIVQKLRSHVSK